MSQLFFYIVREDAQHVVGPNVTGLLMEAVVVFVISPLQDLDEIAGKNVSKLPLALITVDKPYSKQLDEGEVIFNTDSGAVRRRHWRWTIDGTS